MRSDPGVDPHKIVMKHVWCGFTKTYPDILLGLLNIVSAKQMITSWRYVILVSTIIGAVLTPSTDPLTQVLLSSAILLLYFSGVGILLLIKN
jgi:Sec-independent protein secretion pathway component TatC